MDNVDAFRKMLWGISIITLCFYLNGAVTNPSKGSLLVVYLLVTLTGNTFISYLHPAAPQKKPLSVLGFMQSISLFVFFFSRVCSTFDGYI